MSHNLSNHQFSPTDNDASNDLIYNSDNLEIHSLVRLINKTENCTIPALYSFPNWLRDEPISPKAIIISTLLACYLFLALAIICDDYLVPAIERICFNLKVSYDIAGATYLAIATSAPELFVSIVGTFITENDLGIGAIVGSSVFNVFAVPGICGIFAPGVLQMDWWPITRDLFWYILTVAVMSIIILDQDVTWSDSLILLIIYLFYLAALATDRRIQKLFRKEVSDVEIMDTDPNEAIPTYRERIAYPNESNKYIKMYWFLKFPAEFLYVTTVPSPKTWAYFGTLISAILWISFETYLVSWFLTILGFNFRIPDSVMGITFLAVGASVPEAASSLVVTRKGYGAMALSNALGSNTFDILMCLGMPWFIKSVVDRTPVEIDSRGLGYTSATLITTALMFYVMFIITKFQLGRTVGILCTVGYFAYLIFASAVELIMFIPYCKMQS